MYIKMEDSDVIKRPFATAAEEIQGSLFFKSCLEAIAISVPFMAILAFVIGLAFGNVLLFGVVPFLGGYILVYGAVFGAALLGAKPKKRS